MIEQLHFLRPEWFFAFIPLVLFLIIMLRRHGSSISWQAVCDEQLLPHVLTQGSKKTSRLPLYLAAFATSLSIVAAAGPVFKKLPQPVFREQSSLVMLMDLSKSMDATDLKPSRLERAKLKVLDILASRKGGQTALIVYAADAYVVTPLTDDNETISNLVPTLETELMPAQGSHAGSAMKKATKLLKQAGVNEGEILLITDSISENTTEHIRNLNKAGHRLSILGVGTTDGSPVPMNGGFLKDASGAIVIPKLQPQQLLEAARNSGGQYVNLQTNDTDTERLVNLFSSRRTKEDTNETQLTADTWQEEGPWLLLLVLPFAALWPRRGWLLVFPILSSTLLSTVLLSMPKPAYALDTENLWSSSDQKAMKSFNDGDVARAAELFQQDEWKSSAYYRAGDYEKAIKTLKQPTSSDDFYNKGNALAKLGRYPEAVEAYDEALKINENNEDAAFNQALVKKKLEEQNKQQKKNNDQSSDEKNESDQTKNQNGDQQNESSSSDQQSQDQNQSESSADKNTQETQSQTGKEEQAKNNAEPEDTKSGENMENNNNELSGEDREEDQDGDQSLAMQDAEMSEDEQATEQWLKRIPDDPGGLLRRKFLYQYKRMPHQSDKQAW